MRDMDKLSLPTVDIAFFAYQSMEDDMAENTKTVVPFFSVATFIILSFCAGTSMMSDWVRAKPMLSLQGVLSAMLATGAAFGVCVYAGVPFAGINMAAPFLMLG
jgi:predicted RND superfamily exporter protein